MRRVRTPNGEYRCCRIDVNRVPWPGGRAYYVARVEYVLLIRASGDDVEVSVEDIQTVRADTFKEAVEEAEAAFAAWASHQP